MMSMTFAYYLLVSYTQIISVLFQVQSVTVYMPLSIDIIKLQVCTNLVTNEHL